MGVSRRTIGPSLPSPSRQRPSRLSPSRPSVLPVLAAVSIAMALAVATLPAAHADPAASERSGDALPAGTVTAVPAADAAVFCPRPTGRWWDDLPAHGCIELLSTRDPAAPLTPDEVGWLQLGDLPAFPTVDVDAIGAALAAHEEWLAEQAEQEEQAAEQAEDAAPPDSATPDTAAPDSAAPDTAAPDAGAAQEETAQPRPPRRRLPNAGERDALMAACGIDHDRALDSSEQACIEAEWSRMEAGYAPAPSGDWASELLAAVNRERAGAGQPALRSCASLTRTAQEYAEVLVGWGRISHTGPDGSDWMARTERGGYTVRIDRGTGVVMMDGFTGENLAGGHTSVDEVMRAWMGSPGHRANLLSGRWEDVGSGLAAATSSSSPYPYVWVQLFGDGTGNC